MRFHRVREGFYRELWVLVFPIVIQNLITSAVTMADVLMLGRVSQTALSASSLAGQVMFLLSMLYFGLASAITILSSQYWGKQDRDTVSGIFGIGLLISMSVSLFAAVMVYGGLVGQLKQAASMLGAGNYAVKDSFQLFNRRDHYLHTTQTRRRIEQRPPQQHRA